MKKSKKKIALIIVGCILCAAIITLTVLHIIGFGFLLGFREIKNSDTYASELDAMGVFDNTISEELPQTVVHRLIMEHFDAPLPEGKTQKKAIFLGFDGYRADAIANIKDNADSAIMYTKSLGGLYHTFAGGIKNVNEQATSTVPGWATMLTGGWSDLHGLTKNGSPKNDAETVLTTLAKRGYSGSFTVSWAQHLEITYKADAEMAAKEGLPITYTLEKNDDGTFNTVMNYVTKAAGQEKTKLEDPDMIFLTLEYTDHAGHGFGFGNNRKYTQGSIDADKHGYQIIKAIEARDTFDTEDWLIVISTDHGGRLHEHGGQSIMERCTWLATNKAINIDESWKTYAVKAN